MLHQRPSCNCFGCEQITVVADSLRRRCQLVCKHSKTNHRGVVNLVLCIILQTWNRDCSSSKYKCALLKKSAHFNLQLLVWREAFSVSGLRNHSSQWPKQLQGGFCCRTLYLFVTNFSYQLPATSCNHLPTSCPSLSYILLKVRPLFCYNTIFNPTVRLWPHPVTRETIVKR